MEDAIFDNIARIELQAIEDKLSDIDPDDVEVSVSDGVLRLDLRDKTRIVINAHRAAKQIWMAAVATAWHFDPCADGRWRAERTSEELRFTLAKIVHDRIGVSLNIAGGSAYDPAFTRATMPMIAVSLPDEALESAIVKPAAAVPVAVAVAPADEPATIAVIRIWAAIAWADGKLAPVEADALRRLIHAAALTVEERAQAYGFLDHPVQEPTLTTGLPDVAKAGIYRAACRMAKLNRVVEPRERMLLATLSTALNLSPAVTRQIETEIFATPRT
ncbi:MAG: iron donor protein CyaY [Kofleriaceae bacterium]|nr:iron donor protein CyaY [Kofleriaceae bacterium]